MAKFTKGPWEVTESLDHNDNPCVTVTGYDGEAIYEVSCADKTDRANANLIAAAPELYEVVKDGSMNVVGEIMQNYADQLERAGFGKVLDLLQAWDEKALASIATARGEK